MGFRRTAVVLVAALAAIGCASCTAGTSSPPPSSSAPPGWHGEQPTATVAPPSSPPRARPTGARNRAPRGGARAQAPRAPTQAAQRRGAPAPRAFADLLAAHNEVRARHCAPPLRWSRELAEVAQGWADTLKFNGCAFEHSTSRYGENLAYFMPASTGERATRGWYDEVSLYRFARPGFDMRTGHFTQVVWRATERLGCGVVACKGGQIWVCNYDPPGNVEGMYRENVLPKNCR